MVGGALCLAPLAPHLGHWPPPAFRSRAQSRCASPSSSSRTCEGEGQQNAMGRESESWDSNPQQVPGHLWVPLLLTVKTQCPGLSSSLRALGCVVGESLPPGPPCRS